MTYQNPVWNHDFPDPFIATDGHKFYAYATHKNDDGFQLLESGDMVRWTEKPAVFKPAWSDGQYWAPEVHPYRGMWYFIYSAQDRISHHRDIAIAVGDSPAGPFKDLGKLVLGQTRHPVRDDNGAIDGTLFFHGNDAYVLYSQEIPRSIIVHKLSPDLTHCVDAGTVILQPDREIEKGIVEAPTMVFQNGEFWLFYSSGWFQSFKKDACYQVFAAHSKSIFGPYSKQERPLLTTVPDHVYSPGHQTVFQLGNGEWWLAYHAWDASAEPLYSSNRFGRTLRIDRLRWTEAGPATDGPTWTPQPAPTK